LVSPGATTLAHASVRLAIVFRIRERWMRRRTGGQHARERSPALDNREKEADLI
jgi:hypothetical protein